MSDSSITPKGQDSLERPLSHKVTFDVGGIDIIGFVLPDESVEFTVSSVTKAIDKPTKALGQFLSRNSDLAKPFENYEPKAIYYEGYHKPVYPIIPDLALAFWEYWAEKGNEKARAILRVGFMKNIEREKDIFLGKTTDEAALTAKATEYRLMVEESFKRESRQILGKEMTEAQIPTRNYKDALSVAATRLRCFLLPQIVG